MKYDKGEIKLSNMWKKIQIRYWKRKAMKYYRSYSTATGTSGAGLTLAEHLFPSIRDDKNKFNHAIEKLAELGEPVMPTKL